MKTQELEEYIQHNYYTDNHFNTIPEYVNIVEKLRNKINGRRVDLERELNKISILGFDAIVLYCKLEVATNNLLIDMEYIEEYEICSILRDLTDLIKNYLYDLEE